ncbi:esterase B1-like [Anopheles ziemanni]|uniref:esterase B1-like n=1 Tax=Anopheles coustani TaxID=139045 RepID=UPI0026587712|nr:esterase B1-like [Anopheles coustani]XP_058178106.1 esterase B1-like [Anopheles ziemanni]
MAESKITVSLQPGRIVGIKGSLPNGHDCYVFKGIPYAKPPIGELRFRAPVPLASFPVDPLECLVDGPSSYSDEVRLERKSEDCLYLNVFSPELEPQTLLPVMVWVHGGGFYTGSGHSALYDPEYLVQQGAVVVSLNYRLGPLGFLSLPSVGIAGNAGLKDQRMSFRWVQENIDRFGGDPNNVTIFGDSAGGASVHLHYLSEPSRQYFHKAIAQSGTAYNEWLWQREPAERARRLAKLLGTAEDSTDVEKLATLMQASAEKMTAIQSQVMTELEQTTLIRFPFTPVVEQPDSEDAILTVHPVDAAKASFTREIPLILGTTSAEGLVLWSAIEERLPLYASEPSRMVPATLRIRNERDRQLAAKTIKKFFFNERPVSSETKENLATVLGDNLNTFPCYFAAELHVRHQSAPLYMYVFSFMGELNKYREIMKVPPELIGAAHGDELYYLFSSTLFNTAAVDDNSEAAKFREYLCRQWVNLARHGNPSEVAAEWIPVEHPREEVTDDFYPHAFELKEGGCVMTSDFFLERFQFWKVLFKRFNGSQLVPIIE